MKSAGLCYVDVPVALICLNKEKYMGLAVKLNVLVDVNRMLAGIGLTYSLLTNS